MKKLYIILFAIILVSVSAKAADTLRVDPGFGKIQEAIAAVATGGDEAVSNTVFVLQRGGTYLVNQRIQNENYSLTIVADKGNGPRPIVKPGNDPVSSDFQRPFHPQNNLTLKGLYVTGIDENGECDNHIIRGGIAGGTFIFDDCHFDHDWASVMRIDADNMKIYITNCIVSHISDPVKAGNGKMIQDNNNTLDSLVVRNTTIYDIQVDVFRETGGPNGYIEFDHCTFVNIGKSPLHLHQTVKSKITNNQFINCGFFGYTNDQDSVFVIALDTLGLLVPPEMTQEAEISHNNISTDQTVMDALPDTINPVVEMNWVAASFANESSFLNEKITFTSPPPSVASIIGDFWANPSVAVPFVPVGPDAGHDFGYSNAYASYTGGTDGSRLGDQNWEGTVSSIFNPSIGNGVELRCYPNPVEGTAVISFVSSQSGNATLDLYNITGSVVRSIFSGKVHSGENSFNLNANGLEKGLYITKLSLNGQSTVQKIIIK